MADNIVSSRTTYKGYKEQWGEGIPTHTAVYGTRYTDRVTNIEYLYDTVWVERVDVDDLVLLDGSNIDHIPFNDNLYKDVSTNLSLYVDVVNGSDITGDGSVGSPYFTIEQCYKIELAYSSISSNITMFVIGDGSSKTISVDTNKLKYLMSTSIFVGGSVEIVGETSTYLSNITLTKSTLSCEYTLSHLTNTFVTDELKNMFVVGDNGNTIIMHNDSGVCFISDESKVTSTQEYSCVMNRITLDFDVDVSTSNVSYTNFNILNELAISESVYNECVFLGDITSFATTYNNCYALNNTISGRVYSNYCNNENTHFYNDDTTMTVVGGSVSRCNFYGVVNTHIKISSLFVALNSGAFISTPSAITPDLTSHNDIVITQNDPNGDVSFYNTSHLVNSLYNGLTVVITSAQNVPVLGITDNFNEKRRLFVNVNNEFELHNSRYVINHNTISDINSLNFEYKFAFCDETGKSYHYKTGITEAVDNVNILATADGGDTRFVSSGYLSEYIQLNTLIDTPDHSAGMIFYDKHNQCPAYYNDRTSVMHQIGRELWVRCDNNTGVDIPNGSVVAVNDFVTHEIEDGVFVDIPQIVLASNNIKIDAESVIGVTTELIASGESGEITRFGKIGDIDTTGFTSGDPIYLGVNGQWTTDRPSPPDYTLRLGVVGKADVAGCLLVDIGTFNSSDTNVNAEGSFNGICLQKQGVRFVVDTGVIYAEVWNEAQPTKTLPIMLGGVRYTLDTLTNTGNDGYARVALLEGTINTAQINYIYVYLDNGTPTLGASQIFPTEDKCWVGMCSLLDVNTTIADGTFAFQRFNNAIDNGVDDGFVQYITEKLRWEGAKYFDGVEPLLTIDETQSPDSATLSVSSGRVYQLHLQGFVAIDTEYYLVNHPTEPFKKITNLNEIDVDANGGDLKINNRRFGLNIIGYQSSGDINDRLYIMLPSGSYGNNTQCINDLNNYAVTSVPPTLSTAAFRICRVCLRWRTTGGGRYDNILEDEGYGNYQDERGFPLGNSGGGLGSTGGGTVFNDDTFAIINADDPTKIVQFDASQITTDTTRTQTIQDKDGTLAHNEDLINRESLITGLTSSDGVMSILGTTQVTIQGGAGLIVDSFTDPLNVSASNVTWLTQTLSITNISTRFYTEIAINSSGAAFEIAGNATPQQIRDNIILGSVFHNTDAGTLEFIWNTPVVCNGTGSYLNDLSNNNFVRVEGGNISANTAGNLSLTLSELTARINGINWYVDKKNPNIYTQAQIDTLTFDYILSDGSIDNTQVNLTSVLTTDYEPSGLGVVTTIGGNDEKCTIQYVWSIPSINKVYIQYGQYDYKNIEEAYAYLDDDFKLAILPEAFVEHATLVGFVIVKKVGVDLTNTTDGVVINRDSTQSISSQVGDNMGNHTATQNLDLNGYKAVNSLDPVDGQDLATKAYVDTSGVVYEHFALPEDISNTAVYFFSYTKSYNIDGIRSGNNSGLQNPNSCSPIHCDKNGNVTSALLSIKGAGVQNGTVAYPVLFTCELWDVGWTNEGTKLGDIIFELTENVGTYSVGDTNTDVNITLSTPIPVVSGDKLALKFINGNGASDVGQLRNAFVTIKIQ